MKKSIWVIEDGCYSDYHVVGVFTSLAAAEDIQKITGGSINEWPLDPAVEEVRAGMRLHSVLMLRNGDVEHAEECEPSAYDIGGSHRIWERSKAPAYRGRGIPDALHSHVWATDKAHAIKIVNEHRAELIANGEWK